MGHFTREAILSSNPKHRYESLSSLSLSLFLIVLLSRVVRRMVSLTFSPVREDISFLLWKVVLNL